MKTGPVLQPQCSSGQPPVTAASPNSILTSSYEFVLCFLCLVEITDEFQKPQQVKQPLDYTLELSATEGFQTMIKINIFI